MLPARPGEVDEIVRSVGLLGGSFDPPHAGHVTAARHAVDAHGLDEVWLVPVHLHPRGKRLAPYRDRAVMCELAAPAIGRAARVCRAEAALAAPCSTIELLDLLAAPGLAFRIIVGDDLLVDRWHRAGELVVRAPPIVVPRAGRAVSSSEVRAKLVRGEDIAGLVPPPVAEYIAARRLYADPPGATA